MHFKPFDVIAKRPRKPLAVLLKMADVTWNSTLSNAVPAGRVSAVQVTSAPAVAVSEKLSTFGWVRLWGGGVRVVRAARCFAYARRRWFQRQTPTVKSIYKQQPHEFRAITLPSA